MFPKKHVKIHLPHLKKIDEATVKHPEKPFKGNLFILEWNSIEFRKFSKFEQFLRSWDITDPNEINERFPGTTSNTNYEFTNKMKFVISNTYLNQIRNNVLQAYNSLVSVDIDDTMIREYCMKPSEMNIQVAFFLIADCLFDEETNYFDRKYHINHITSSLLWRYWSFSTGRGLLRKRCLIDELENNLKYSNSIYEKSIYYYIKDFDYWLEELDKAYDFVGIPENTETIGESKNEE